MVHYSPAHTEIEENLNLNSKLYNGGGGITHSQKRL